MHTRNRVSDRWTRPAILATLLVTSFLAILPAFGDDDEKLYGAAIEGDALVVENLLVEGADPNYRAADSYTPLLVAAKNGHAEVCRMLIAAGASVSADASGWPALHLAADGGHKEVVEVLLAAGVRVDIKLGDYTALDLAAEGGHAEIVALLAAAGGESVALGGLLFNAAGEGDLGTVRELLSQGVDVQWTRPENGWTSLHAAAYDGRVEVVKLLLSKGAKVSAKDKGRSTPMALAAQEGKTDTVRLLLDAGSSLEHEDDYGMTVIQRAALGGSRETLIFLLKRGAKLEGPGTENTPLALAAGEGQLEMVELLIEKGADVNFRSDAGSFTALHRSVTTGSYEVSKLLLSHGANPNVTNRLGKTPLQLAIDSDFDELADLLRKSGAKK